MFRNPAGIIVGRGGGSVGEIRRRLQEAAMGVSGQREQSLSPKTQKDDDDNAILKRINKTSILLQSTFKRKFTFTATS